MKRYRTLFHTAYKEAVRKHYDHIVIAVDLHNTIISSSKFNAAIKRGNGIQQAIDDSISPAAIPALKAMTNKKFIKILLFSGTEFIILQKITKYLEQFYEIHFDFIGNPRSKTTTDSQSFKNKPYYSLLLDDKAGFEMKDWPTILLEVTRL